MEPYKGFCRGCYQAVSPDAKPPTAETDMKFTLDRRNAEKPLSITSENNTLCLIIPFRISPRCSRTDERQSVLLFRFMYAIGNK